MMLKKILLYTASIALCVSCANRCMGPQGGKMDETPPRLSKSTPANGETNVWQQSILLTFDEYVQMDDPYANVTVSPPQKQMPVIKLAGKKITVELRDTLLENTTYTIDFGNAIADNNEKNVLRDFSFAFATGAEIDTLNIAGTLLNAQTLNPVAGSLVGIYRNLSDTAFTTLPFLRYTKSDANGHFSVKNVKEGTYRVFAMSENWNDAYCFDPTNPVSIAFTDNIVQPLADTLLRDTLGIADSLRFTSLILFQYEEKKEMDTIMVEANRERREKFTLTFSRPVGALPQTDSLDLGRCTWKISPEKTAITVWLDSVLAKMDTLNFYLRHLDEKTDSVEITLPIQKTKSDAPVYVGNNITSGKLEYYDSLKLFFDVPVAAEAFEKIHLRRAKDTVDMPIQFRRVEKDGFLQAYAVAAALGEGESYTLAIDSAAIYDVFGKAADKTSFGFKRRSVSEYSTLGINLQPFDERIVVELLNEKDQPVRQAKADAGGTYFDYVDPGNYYLRLYFDENNNAAWDGGRYTDNRQPEPVYYYPKKISLRANWEVQEDWYYQMPVLQQKPPELKEQSAKK